MGLFHTGSTPSPAATSITGTWQTFLFLASKLQNNLPLLQHSSTLKQRFKPHLHAVLKVEIRECLDGPTQAPLLDLLPYLPSFTAGSRAPNRREQHSLPYAPPFPPSPSPPLLSRLP